MENKSTYIVIAIIVIIAVIAIVAVMMGGKKEENNTESSTTNSSVNNENKNTVSNTTANTEIDPNKTKEEIAAEKQMAMPEKGDTIAIMHVKDYGDITFKFFEDYAPKAVENFLTHAKEGYYDGLTFHRVMNEFMIQGGDPLGTGTGGESIWGTGFGVELNEDLVPYKGSLCMAMSSLPNSIGSQFFITQANYNPNKESYFQAFGLYDKFWGLYKKYGGDLIDLYMKYTVFGQVIDGIDVVDKIAAVETDIKDKPTTDIIIESIEVTEYK